MMRLMLAWAARDVRTLLGQAAVFFTAGALVSAALTLVISAAAPTGQAALASAPPGSESVVAQIATFLIILGIGVPTIVVVSGVSASSLTASRHIFASWRLAGASPAQVRGLTLSRMFLCAVITSLLGSGLGLFIASLAMPFLLNVTTIDVDIPVTANALAPILTVLIVAGLAVLSGLRPANLAARVPAIEAIRKPPDRSPQLGWGGWVGATVTLVACVFLAAGILNQQDPGPASTLALGLAFALAILVSVLMRPIGSWLVRAWTSVIPAATSPAWMTARATATNKIGVTSTTVAPLVIAMIVLGSYFSCVVVWANATGSHDQALVNAQQGLILFTPGAVIAFVGAAAALFATSGGRNRELAQFTSLGATPSALTGAALLESAIYTLTAVLVALPCVALVALLFATALQRVGLSAAIAIDFPVLGLCVAIGWIVTAAATLPPVAAWLRSRNMVYLSSAE